MPGPLAGIRVLEATPHRGKLRTGHLHGNKFTLRIRDTPVDRMQDVERVIARLSIDGIPNYYGEQRFGRDGDNVAKARAWLVEGGRAPRTPFERKLLASSLQSELFNRVVAERVSCNELGVVRQRLGARAQFLLETRQIVQKLGSSRKPVRLAHRGERAS